MSLKAVIITGASSGIGYETARILLETGKYRVCLVARNKEKLENAIQSLGGASDVLTSYPCDFRDVASIRSTVLKIAGTSKGIYGLINNAGMYPFGGIESTSPESWDETFDINLKAPFLFCQAAVPHMAKHPGGARIVNVSSTAGVLPNHFALAYSVSKAGLVHFTRTLAKEVGPQGITANCVCPGIVRSPLHEAYHANESQLEGFYNKRGAAFPLGRVGDPIDVAGPIRFLLSDEAAWITGDVFIIDGGRLLL